jgi:hypothetical protein
MQRRPLLLFLFLMTFGLAYAQPPLDVNLYRTYDGSQNNLSNPDWGQAGTNLLRLSGTAYADGISAPNGTNRPNPRIVSNTLFAQDGALMDVFHLSDFVWVWGQFIDHDVGLTPDGSEPAIIPVPAGDPAFDPLGLGTAMIPMLRNFFDPTTGTDPSNPREHPNMITAYIDGSGVYGSSKEQADWLRSFENGKMKVSAGNFLPYNTVTGEVDGAIDPDAPHMDDAVGVADRLFVAGDPRANENVLLLSFHTLFVREHNRLCDELLKEHPDWTDEQLYQHARKMVGGLIQSITYEEWLPAMGVQLPDYAGYDSGRHPQLSNVFTAAAFRMGHTLLSGDLIVMDNNGDPMSGGSVQLRDVFFIPSVLVDMGGLDPFIKGMATQTQQRFDAKVIDDVRNFLFGPPEAGIGGLDLASININRGRERGLPDFNSIRQAFGLSPYSFFQQINSDATVFSALISLYANLDNIDPWVGMLAEAPMNGAIFGPTVMAVMQQQFGALRDGDRFYYENDPVLTDQEKNWIKNKTLHDVIMKNTNIVLMQDNVFEAMSHDEICDNMTSTVEGRFFTESGTPVSGVDVSVVVNGSVTSVLSNSNGVAFLGNVAACDAESFTASLDDDVDNGVSTLDLIRIQRHILGVESLASPYKHIAADVDNNGSITISDLIEIRRVVLSISNAFPNNTPWRFVAADYVFDNPDSPLGEDFPEASEAFDIMSEDFEQEYVAIKVGDVTEDAVLNLDGGTSVEDRDLVATLPFTMQDMTMEAGETYEVVVNAGKVAAIEGFQFALQYDADLVAIQAIEGVQLPKMDDKNYAIDTDNQLIRMSWNGSATLEEGTPLFAMTIQAKQAMPLQAAFALNKEVMQAAAYDSGLESMNVALRFDQSTDMPDQFMLMQNLPNPFSKVTMIPFYMAESGAVRLSIMDLAGKVIVERSANFDQGYHQWEVNAQDLPADGIYTYRLETGTIQASKRMVVQR